MVLLDSTLNYVLLVQGYFASKNSWGFPKGKVNEDEIPIQCAIREVYEETGFDATEKIVSNQRPLQSFLNDTLIRLYIATDVPMDYPFEPHLRKEIRYFKVNGLFSIDYYRLQTSLVYDLINSQIVLY